MQMLSRFSLYGFLKNLNFFKPFFILFYLSLGLSFLQIGILVSFQNICINLMEIPSGALADNYGRKNSMVISFISYILAFIVFGFTHSFGLLFPALFLYSIGDAFRTGTHKAMIFDWLRINKRLDEKTKIYGFTRSWSKYGSALSVIIATIIVILTTDYRWIFFFSVIPYILGMINIAYYPSYLNKKSDNKLSLGVILQHTVKTLKTSFSCHPLRRLIVQSMGLEGIFDVTKDYLQPILQTQALLLATYIALPEKESTALVVGIVYFILFVLSAGASRRSHLFLKHCESDKSAIIVLIFTASLLVFISSVSLFLNLFIVAIAAYITYYIAQNLWRPILVAQYDDFADSSEQATILSIESQTKTVGITIMAPLAGLLADHFGIQSALLFLAGVLLLLGIYSFKTRK